MKLSKSSLLLSNTNVQTRRDIKHRILFNMFERERRYLLKDRANLTTPLSLRLKTQQTLNKLSGTQIKIKNRCAVSGRSRSIYRQFKLSRLLIKELSSYGLLPGVRKSSW